MNGENKKELKEVVKEGFQESFAEVWEGNLKPAFDEVNGRLGGVENRLGGVENRLGGVENRLDNVEVQVVTKSYLDDKLADLRGDVIVKLRKQDEKLN